MICKYSKTIRHISLGSLLLRWNLDNFEGIFINTYFENTASKAGKRMPGGGGASEEKSNRQLTDHVIIRNI
jgi:hypothetical protein